MTQDSGLLTRRALCAGLSGAIGMVGLGMPEADAAPDQVQSTAGLVPFMKIYARLDPGVTWYQYSGTIEMALPDHPVLPLTGVETLIRRLISPKADGTFDVTTWEANYFCDIVTRRPVDSVFNAVTGRTVTPVHFREGPRTKNWNEASLQPRTDAAIESRFSIRNAGPYSWLYRELHIDAAHPLDMAKWPLEASGPRNRSGSFSTHCAVTDDVLNPRLNNAPCSFSYEAIFGWLPWLLMGQRPGNLVWRASGLKLRTMADIPTVARQGFERVWPAIFAPSVPWADEVMLWDDYARQHKPAT